MFVDELKVHIKAGKGGDGVVRWHHEKGREFMGPAGGDGGNGGDVYIVGVRDASLLFKYRHVKEFNAENGVDGGKNSLFGRGGEDLEIKLPVGSIVTNLDNGKVFELLENDQKIKILSGGFHGFGNEHFKGSTNINPIESTPGKVGQEADFLIELKLIADVGLIGLPNAGKSSLLNSLTKSKSKVANYAFTTLDPHLGALHGVIIADIPGIIEGASEGKGLGIKFLRHISRTRILLHCISVENEDILNAYETIRNELISYDQSLDEKREIILITKTDLIDGEKLKEITALFEKEGKEVLNISLFDDVDIKKISDFLVKTVDKG